jgi:hypothetical protein
MPDPEPHRYLLPAGTVLWRIHSQKTDATEFTPTRRLFRSPFDHDPGCTAGPDAQALVGDLLLRGIPVADRPFRTVRRVRILGMRASAVSTAAELSLVSLLTTPALLAAGLTPRLLFTERADDEIGRWVPRIRDRAPWAHGLVQPADHDRTRHLVVLFGDRCAPDTLGAPPIFTVDLDDEYGAVWLNGLLAPHHARVMPPRNGNR